MKENKLYLPPTVFRVFSGQAVPLQKLFRVSPVFIIPAVLIVFRQICTLVSIYVLALYCLCGGCHMFPFVRLCASIKSTPKHHMSLVS